MIELGKLQEVNVRELWKHEQYDFSNWLSKDENIEYLNDILGLSLTDIDKEKYVGPYRCDIFATDETSGVKVIIENQLDATNHDHLGKIITYASGLDAKYIVWIVKEAKEEHRAAVEWLNNNTNDDINFFLIELHAYRIGDSAPAPKFEVVEKPNGFTKIGNIKTKDETLLKCQSCRLDFWNRFNQHMIERGKPFNIRKPSTDHWTDVALGSTHYHISIELINIKHYVRIGMYLTGSKDRFDKLLESKEQVEEAFGGELVWERRDNRKHSVVYTTINGLDFDHTENYPTLMDKIIDQVIKLKEATLAYM